MSEATPTETPEVVTTEKIQEMISTALGGHATKYERQLNKMFEKFSEQVAQFTPKTDQTAVPATPGQQQADPKVAALERDFAELQKRHTAAEEKVMKAEQSQALSNALGSYSFASEKAKEVAVRTFESQMKRSENGEFFIGDRGLKDAVAEQMKELPGLLAAKNVGSSGAIGTQGSAHVGLDTLIKPNMSKEEISQAYSILRQQR